MYSHTNFHPISRWHHHLYVLCLWLACSGGLLQLTSYGQSPITIALTSPSSQTSFTTNRNALTLRGTASSAAGIQRVTWTALTTQREGAAQGTANWAIDNIWFLPGTNEITVTAYDFAGNQASKTFYITYQVENVAPKIGVTSPSAGQVIPLGSKPIISWWVTGTTPPAWTRTHNTPDVQIMLYRNGIHFANLTGMEIGVTSVSNYVFNYPPGDGYQIRVASHEGPGLPGSYEAFSPVFTIGPTGTPAITSFTVGGPNAEPSNTATVKLGEVISFRWQLSGGAASQLRISNVGDITGRDSKLIPTTQVGQFTYTMTASNSTGSATQSVTVNVLPNPQYNQPEVLYNGITLDSAWPPKPANYPDTTQLPPYLVNPPSLIPINTGRQLFVDDFLIESSSLTRQFHPATMYSGNPVLKPSTTIEKAGLGPMAMPYSNGVFFDPADKLYKMWYMCGYRVNICYATSPDGLNWNRPNLDIVPGTNIIYKDTNLVDSYTNWIDLEDPIPARRFKMLRVVFNTSDQFEYHLHYSGDGIHWGPAVVTNKSLVNDAGSYFYNPFRKKWGLTLKDLEPGPIRLRRYTEQDDLSFALKSVVTSTPSAAETLYVNTSKFMRADALDTAHPSDANFTPNLYAFQAAAYESLMLAQIAILRGNGDGPRPKLNEVYFGFSRDGFYWHRPNRQAMFSVGTKYGDWNWGNVQPVSGGPLIVGDQMYFYFSGRGGTLPGTNDYADSNGGAGLAMMRRDGFASLNAGGNESSMTTRRVTFDGRYLFVNAEIASGGSLCAEILNENNQAIAPFTKANCQVFNGNSTKQLLGWTGASDLSSLIGKPVKFRFYLKNGKLFSFWVSLTTEGASRGYVGAGGPGFTTNRDIGGGVVTPQLPTVSLTPATQNIGTGQAASLTYSITNASSAAFSPAIAGCNIALVNGAASGTCKPVGGALGTFNFVLTAQGNGKTVTASATVVVQGDVTPPVLTLVSPTQSVLPTGTNQVKLELTTNENAVCRYATNASLAFASMTLFPQTGALSHSVTVNTANGQSYSYYLRCTDALNNVSNPLVANFSIGTATNKALQFDGKTGLVTVSASANAPRTKQWTIETWVKTSAQPSIYQFILGNSTSNDLRITPGPLARAMVSINTGAITNFIGSKIINDGKWHHIAAVRNNDKLYLYVDGQADKDSETSQTAKPVNAPEGDNELSLKAIGNRGAGAEWFEGQVDDVRLHNRAFTTSEVSARYNNGKGQAVASEAGLALGFSFNEPAGAAVDISPSGYRGTLNGGVLRVTRASTFTSVSAASFAPNTASESIVAGFGVNLTNTTQVSRTLPLPTQLGGVSITVRDSKGVGRLAPLFFVSPTQVNYLIPSGTAEGLATVSLAAADGTVFTGSFNAGPVAPGVFTANADGAGIPAALALRVKANGATSYEPIAKFDQTTSRFVAQPLDLGPAGEQVYLILYGTGFRGRTSLSNVIARFADTNSNVQFAGPSPGFIGLDQVNVLIPRTLIGRGNITLTLTVDGKAANAVTVNIR